jgi:hypothetical protein
MARDRALGTGGGGLGPTKSPWEIWSHHSPMANRVFFIFFFTGNGDISLIKELLRTYGIPSSLLFRNSQYLHGIKDLVLMGFHVLNLSLCTAQVFCSVY